MSDKKKSVLAMYDIRAKQEFIYRTNKIKEIVGASWLIRDCFYDYLCPAAVTVSGNGKGIYWYRYQTEEDTDFSEEGYYRHLEEGYIGEVVYDGGGNYILLFKDEDVFRDVTYEFTKKLLDEVGTLRVLGTCVEVDDFGDYKRDQKRLYSRHFENEASESAIPMWACPPIVRIDRQTMQPLIVTDGGRQTKETAAKLKKYESVMFNLRKADSGRTVCTEFEKEFYTKNENILDKLVEEKGKDSQLAVIYIDGNGMGAKVEKATEGCKDYKSSVKRLRAFSEEIQLLYVEEGLKNALSSIVEKGDNYRIVVSAGDEVNFIVKAKNAFSCAKAYLDGLKIHNETENDIASACAGIAVFHSHSSYADAYRIAEECCESGKKQMKENGLNCAAFIDFHICQGAVGISLDAIRKDENRGGVSRPWMIWSQEPVPEKASVTDFSQFEELIRMMSGFARTNIKGLAQVSQKSAVALDIELRRIWAHASTKDNLKYAEWERLFLMSKDDKKGNENKRKRIYDLSISYDLWFRNSKENIEEKGEM